MTCGTEIFHADWKYIRRTARHYIWLPEAWTLLLGFVFEPMAFVNVGITHACCCIFEESSGQSLPNACRFVAGSWAGLGRCEYSTNQHPCIEHLIFSWVVNLIKMAKQNFYTVLQPFFLIILICLPSQFQVRNSKLLLIFNATDLLGAASN